MRRVRVRAVAFHAGDETKSPGRGPPGKAGRVTNFTYDQLGPLIHVFGKNWEVSDCDLYASDKVRSPSLPTESFGEQAQRPSALPLRQLCECSSSRTFSL